MGNFADVFSGVQVLPINSAEIALPGFSLTYRLLAYDDGRDRQKSRSDNNVTFDFSNPLKIQFDVSLSDGMRRIAPA